MRTMLVGISAAVALAAPAAVAQAEPQPFMGGLTSQHEPVVVKLSGNARAIKETDAALDLRCTDGGRLTFTDDYTHVRVARSGRFHSRYDTGNFELDDRTNRIQGSLTGRVRHAGGDVRGRWTLTWTITDAQGTVTTCRSGAVHFEVTS